MAPVTIDDFERSSLSYYTGDTGGFVPSTDRSVSGSQSLAIVDNATSQRIYSAEGGGLGHYPEPGEAITFSAYRPSGATSTLNFLWGGPDTDNHYGIEFGPYGVWAYQRIDDAQTEIAWWDYTGAFEDQWTHHTIEWSEDAGTLTLSYQIVNSADEVVIDNTATTSTLFSSRGIGFSKGPNITEGNWDSVQADVAVTTTPVTVAGSASATGDVSTIPLRGRVNSADTIGSSEVASTAVRSQSIAGSTTGMGAAAGIPIRAETISGPVVTLDGAPVEGARITAIDSEQEEYLRSVKTDANGEWSIRVNDVPSVRVMSEYQDDSGTQYKDYSKPFVETGLPQPVGEPFAWWPLDEGSGDAVADQAGDEDGTIIGGEWETESGSWVGDSAVIADGVDDYIETTSWGEFGSTHFDALTFCMTVRHDGTDGTGTILGRRDTTETNNTRVQVAFGDPGNTPLGGIGAYIRDGGGGWGYVYTDQRFDDGDRHRIVFTKRSDAASDWEIWVDGQSVPVSIGADNCDSSTIGDFTGKIAIQAYAVPYIREVEDFLEGAVDDVVIYGTDLDPGQIEADYDRQPWA